MDSGSERWLFMLCREMTWENKLECDHIWLKAPIQDSLIDPHVSQLFRDLHLGS
jgi:hypothetical protein